MSFGRWLLVHSFSLMLLVLLLLMYLFRQELQLETAYRQLLSLEPSSIPGQTVTRNSAATPGTKPLTPPVESSREDTFSSQKTDPGPDPNSAETIPVVPTIQAPISKKQPSKDAWQVARKAYWDGDYARAIREYQRLIKRHPENPDYLGELGNIYYSLNNNEQAARYYFQAAQLFLLQGKKQYAVGLVAPLMALDRELGERLRRQING